MEEVLRRDHSATRPGEEDQLVTFYLGNEEFGFDIMSVQEIIRQPLLARIPMAPDYVEGIANLRGMVLPVIDTRTRFGMKREDDTDRTRVLVVDVDGVKTGLRVDRVRQVTRIQRSDIEPPPAVLRAGLSADSLHGVVKLEQGKRLIMSLNPRAICQIGEDLGRDAGLGLGAGDENGGRAQTGDRASNAGAESLAQLVSFKLGAEEYAFPMERVREILRVERPNVVPDTAPYFLGILTVRGNILPVIDLRVLLGLDTFASEVCAKARHARATFSGWLDAASGFSSRGGAAHPGSFGCDSLRTWIAEFATSSQVLMDTVSTLRVANDEVARGWQQTCDGTEAHRSREYFDAEVAPYAQQTLRLLEEFERLVADNISEDQRLIVVQTNGALLALVVDKVREVLNIQTSLVDPPPKLSGSDNREMSGVAKLADGKRLIMLLDADNLIRGQALEAIQQAGGSLSPGSQDGEGKSMDRHGSTDVDRALGEQQFVTFRLADGEYGIPISQIQEIDRSSKMTRIPKSAHYVDGITNLRGEVIPVINARKRFMLPDKEADERTRVIILESNGKKTGLLVDSVREVMNLASKDVAPPPASIASGIEKQYISGIGKVDNGKRMIVLLDVSKVIEAS